MPADNGQIPANWYETSFGALYPVVYAHRSVEAAAPEARFAAEQLELSPDDALLDLCCGNGRHLAHLASRVGSAVGLDYSPHLLAFAAKALDETGTCLVRADMKRIPFVNHFDVVTNFFTSFGYFPTDDENLEVIRGVARALKPGGRWFIDYVNAGHVMDTLVPHSVRERDGYTIEETRWIDTSTRRVEKSMVVTRDGIEVWKTGESVRLYEAGELTAMLERGGLQPHRMFGDFDGSDVGGGRPRMLIVGGKA
ncbi:MAG: class I SAM-dependent methyltransferase [bacterium]|nr:class I SAM-dependent methyltransferase [bacterium]